MNSKTKQIYQCLKSDYEGTAVPDGDLRFFAEELYYHVFKAKGSLVEVMLLVDKFESDLLSDGIDFGISQECFIFGDIVNLLDINGKNAQRLYNTFLEFRDFGVFTLLMSDYGGWLTADQKREVLKIAMGEFDKTLMEDYKDYVF